MKSVAPPGIPLVAGVHWWMPVRTGVFFALVAAFVDLTPKVDENFFFSTGDPSWRQSKTISYCFPSQAQLVLDVSSSDIFSPRYLSRIARLTRRVKDIDEVTNVKSMINGPKSYKDAAESPFWSRLLIARNHTRAMSLSLSTIKIQEPGNPAGEGATARALPSPMP